MLIYPKNPLQYKLYDACAKGHLGMVAHLLEDQKLKAHIDVSAEDYHAVLIACKTKNKNLIQYLLTRQGVQESLYVKQYLEQHNLMN